MACVPNLDGCLIGFIVGDAIGGPLEWTDRDVINCTHEMETNYLHGFKSGTWTEKTAEMLCVIESIMDDRFDLTTFLSNYYQLVRKGYLSPNDKVFEMSQYIKITCTKIANVLKYKKTIPISLNPLDHQQVDCEPLYRIGPIVLKHFYQPVKCLQQVEQFTQITHIARVCVDGCRFFASLMIGAILGIDKTNLLSDKYNLLDITTHGPLKYNSYNKTFIEDCTDTVMSIENDVVRCRSTKENIFLKSLYPSISKIQRGSYKHKTREQIVSDTLIINVIEAALWAFYNTNTFEDGCVMAINLGVNSSGIGAVYGQLAGLYYGISTIPERWINKLFHLDEIQTQIHKVHKVHDIPV